MPLVPLELRETGETLVRMVPLVLLAVMETLDLKDALVLLVTKDLLALLVRRETSDLLDPSVLKAFKVLAVLRVSLDPKDCQDLKVPLAQLAPLVKRELEVSVESLVNLDLVAKSEALD